MTHKAGYDVIRRCISIVNSGTGKKNIITLNLKETSALIYQIYSSDRRYKISERVNTEMKL